MLLEKLPVAHIRSRFTCGIPGLVYRRIRIFRKKFLLYDNLLLAVPTFKKCHDGSINKSRGECRIPGGVLKCDK